MPLHDWRNVPENVFHAFHLGWMWTLSGVLNRGGLPDGYLARPEESLGLFGSDALVLDSSAGRAAPRSRRTRRGTGPRVPVLTLPRASPVPGRQRRIAIFSSREERRVAVIEIVSRGNKDSREKAASLEEKILAYLHSGLHVGLIDLWPTPRSRSSLLAGIVRSLGGGQAAPAVDRSLTSFECSEEPSEVRLYVDDLEVGKRLPDLAVFLAPGLSVFAPLEEAYARTLRELPASDRAALG